MPRFTYTGDQRVIYSFYLDVSNPKAPTTLEPEPGWTYEIRQAEGHTQIQPNGDFIAAELAMPPDANWRETSDPTWFEVAAKKAAEDNADTPAPAVPIPAARATKKKEQADG